MPTKALNDRFLSSIRVKTRTNYSDTKVRGLTLRVSPQGSKGWYFVYRIKGKPSQWLLLGSYPALGLADARKTALDHRRTVDVDGIDPIARQRAEEEAAKVPAPTVFTFTDLAKLYAVFAQGRKKTWKDDIGKINRYLIPAWGTRAVKDITRSDVHELLDRLIADGMTVGVNRVQAVISRLFTVALDRGHIDAHPAARMLKRAAERPRDRVLTDDELRTLWTGLDAHDGPEADVIRLRALLGQRGDEIIGMAWSEINETAQVWEMPGRRTKNGRPHAVPLGPTAQTIIARQRARVAQTETKVFPTCTRWTDDYRALGTIHGGAYEWKDLRRTVATRLAGLGYSETTIGRVLNHARYTVTARHYNQHEYLAERRAAIEAWDRELTRIVEGKTSNGAVLAFTKGA